MAEIGFTDVTTDAKTTPTQTYGHKAITKDGEEYHVVCAVFTEPRSVTLASGLKDGFLEIGQECKSSLANYISTIPAATKDNTILFITGYNGGAAAANVAGRLSDDLANSSSTFVYTFASPNYECDHDPSAKAPNFHTFTNTDDDVTMKPEKRGTIGKDAVEREYTFSSLNETERRKFNKVYLYLADTLYVNDVRTSRASTNNLCQTYMSFALCDSMFELSDDELERHLGMSRENGITLTAKDAKVNPNEKTVLKRTQVLSVSGEQGAVTYSKSSGDSGITVSKNGKVTVKKNVEPGTYHVGISASAAGDEFYKPKTVNQTVKIVVKRVNTITVTPRTATVTAGKKVTLPRSDVLTMTNAKGTVTYAKKSGNAKISIAKTTGKVTIKKGLKKGKTYKVKVAVNAAGDDTYAPKTVTKTFAIRMKA
ncbi:MAG: hypothetical protein IJ087_11885 [Eggerthellaceae bacterium]|nr:hypothetical protein [Eggerthellaceae bacterium]